jgi:hypothetical protein
MRSIIKNLLICGSVMLLSSVTAFGGSLTGTNIFVIQSYSGTTSGVQLATPLGLMDTGTITLSLDPSVQSYISGNWDTGIQSDHLGLDMTCPLMSALGMTQPVRITVDESGPLVSIPSVDVGTNVPINWTANLYGGGTITSGPFAGLTYQEPADCGDSNSGNTTNNYNGNNNGNNGGTGNGNGSGNGSGIGNGNGNGNGNGGNGGGGNGGGGSGSGGNGGGGNGGGNNTGNGNTGGSNGGGNTGGGKHIRIDDGSFHFDFQSSGFIQQPDLPLEPTAGTSHGFATTVPEPSTLVTGGSGLVVLSLIHLLRRRWI